MRKDTGQQRAAGDGSSTEGEEVKLDGEGVDSSTGALALPTWVILEKATLVVEWKHMHSSSR